MWLNNEIVNKIKEYVNNVNSVTELSEVVGINRVTATKYCNLLEIKIQPKLRQRNDLVENNIH